MTEQQMDDEGAEFLNAVSILEAEALARRAHVRRESDFAKGVLTAKEGLSATSHRKCITVSCDWGEDVEQALRSRGWTEQV